MQFGSARLVPSAGPVTMGRLESRFHEEARHRMSDSLLHMIDDVLPAVTELRHALHAHPEASFEEHETARRVREALAKVDGLKVYPPFVGTDVVAVLNEGRDGPCLALRADMDALPIEEAADASELPYRSTIPGKMHACGHDGHTAMLVGTAMVLAKMAKDLPGKVVFVFQPAEEEGGGGRKVCEAGVVEKLGVQAIIAQHAWPTETVGQFALRPGLAMASNSPFYITVRGKGTHGAYPHRGIDPVMVAAHIIVALQTVVSRTVNPLEAAVVSVGHIAAGKATNIIPDACEMNGTIRYLEPEVGEHVKTKMREIVEHTARAHCATAELRIEQGYPTTINDETMSRLVEQTAKDLYGPDAINMNEPASMGVEDFSYYGQKVPAVMYRLGIRPKDCDSYPALHNPGFNFNDEAAPIGIRMFCELTKRYLAGRQ